MCEADWLLVAHAPALPGVLQEAYAAFARRGKGLILLHGPPPRLPLPLLNAMVQHPMYDMANITRVTAAGGQSMVRGDISLGALAGVLRGTSAVAFGGGVPLLPLLEARDAYNQG